MKLSNYVKNNLTTTGEGFIADARTVKTLADMVAAGGGGGDPLWSKTGTRIVPIDLDAKVPIKNVNIYGRVPNMPKVGEYYMGGIIFAILGPSDPGYVEGNEKVAICATQALPDNHIWSYPSQNGGTFYQQELLHCNSVAIGGGLINTNTAMAVLGINQNPAANENYAFALARAYQSDDPTVVWNLPTIGESSSIYALLKVGQPLEGNVDLNGGTLFWTSTEYSATKAYLVQMASTNYSSVVGDKSGNGAILPVAVVDYEKDDNTNHLITDDELTNRETQFLRIGGGAYMYPETRRITEVPQIAINADYQQPPLEVIILSMPEDGHLLSIDSPGNPARNSVLVIKNLGSKVQLTGTSIIENNFNPNLYLNIYDSVTLQWDSNIGKWFLVSAFRHSPHVQSLSALNEYIVGGTDVVIVNPNTSIGSFGTISKNLKVINKTGSNLTFTPPSCPKISIFDGGSAEIGIGNGNTPYLVRWDLAETLIVLETPAGAIDGVNKTYTLAHTPKDIFSIKGAGQAAQAITTAEGFTVNGKTITFTESNIFYSPFQLTYITKDPIDNTPPV